MSPAERHGEVAQARMGLRGGDPRQNPVTVHVTSYDGASDLDQPPRRELQLAGWCEAVEDLAGGGEQAPGTNSSSARAFSNPPTLTGS
jgi:hypothetical protein